MSVRAEIETAAHAKALVVPIQAVVERDAATDAAEASGRRRARTDEIKVVFVVEDGKARQRPVDDRHLGRDARRDRLRREGRARRWSPGPTASLRDLKDGDAVQISKTADGRQGPRTKDREPTDDEDEED